MIAPQELMAPDGELEPAMFPGLTEPQRVARLQVYLDRAVRAAADVADTERDSATVAYAYHLAYKARMIQLASETASTNIPSEIATARTDSQRATFERLANEWLGVFNSFTPVTTIVEETLILPPSGTSKTQTGWGG